MSRKLQNEKIILGLKIRKLRTDLGLSFVDFSKLTGLSTSYLNEIEKGKKFPKEDKIKIIAKAFNITPESLISPELPGSLTPIKELLHSNFLNELPLDIFGLDLSKVIEVIAGAPSKVGAFVATLVDLSRNYALAEENFYFGALRAYLEMHNNYFEEIENQVDEFISKFQLKTDTAVPVTILGRILEEEFHYNIIKDRLNKYPELSNIRSLFIQKNKKLLLNGNLTNAQQAFQFGKEIGFNFLNLKERAMTSSLLTVNSFEEVLNHFKAGYFSAALLINRDSFIKDLKQLFNKSEWDGKNLLNILDKYEASPEMLFQRMTNLMPKFLGIENIFFLRSIYNSLTSTFRINRELHINQKHPPHSNGLKEHYCRRWLDFSLLKKLSENVVHKNDGQVLIGVQNIIFNETAQQYLTITVAMESRKNKFVSVTLGILKDEAAEKNIQFLNDSTIPTIEVGTTCERCPIKDCKERVANPVIIEKKEGLKKVFNTIEKLSE